jgi:SAM-dependent methyltransferase
MSQETHDRLRQFWDLDAQVYDRSPTHAGTEPVEAGVWRAALIRHLPPPPAEILDAGAGTGAMTLLMAELGYRVTALDLSSVMLARAIEKAAMRGLDIRTWVAPATEPPPGRFDAVVERHLLWTLPDPVAALAAWRSAAPMLVSYEGIWHRSGPVDRVMGSAVEAVRKLRRVPHEHHGSYDPDLQESLPLARRMGPAALMEAAGAAGWRLGRIERLRDVEWARRLASPSPLLGWLETRPHFALLAEA